jgi:subtilisin-like proprotein convertase family protein
MLVGEILYDLATRDLPAAGLDQASAWQLAERLWYETRPGSGGVAYSCLRGNANSCGSSTWFQKMRVADDDDGDLTNGTPHAAALFAAFDRHALACGSAGNAEHQSTGSCPALAPPSLTVVEGAGGTELTWSAVSGATEYRVYRGELGCDRQQIPIAVVSGTTYADTTSDQELPRFYRVEPFAANPACNGPVSNCESTPPGGRLQYLAHRFVEDGSDDNNIPDPGETVQMPVSLFNRGIGTATAIQGTLRLVDPSQGVISDPDATWAAIDYAGFQESDAPWFELTVDEAVPCGDVLALEMDYVATNAPSGTVSIDVPLGDPHRDFLQVQTETLLADPGSVATSTIVIDQDHPILELDVSVFVQHTFEEELIIELTSPLGTIVRLHSQTDIPLVDGVAGRYDQELNPDGPGAMSDFNGESTLGTWTLRVEDTGSVSSGTGFLQDWTLHIDVDSGFDCHPFGCAEPIPGNPVTGVLVNKVVNGAALDLVFDWNNMVVAGYHLIQSSTPDFAAETDAGQTAGTTLTLPDGANTTPDLTFFLVRGANSCDQQGP